MIEVKGHQCCPRRIQDGRVPGYFYSTPFFCQREPKA